MGLRERISSFRLRRREETVRDFLGVVEIETATTEASGSRSGRNALARETSENIEIPTACRKSSFLVSWNGFIPSE